LINKLTKRINQLTNQWYNICIENISIDESGTTASVSPIPRQKILLSQFVEVISTITTIQLIVLLFGVGEISFVGDVCFEQDFNPFQVRAGCHHILPPQVLVQMLIISFQLT